PGSADVNGADAIRDCGIIDEDAKATLLRNCVALVQPSQNASFSRSIMEAWRCGRPVAAHARCLATATAVRRSEGGWLADSEDEWAALFTTIDRTSVDCLDQVGANGAEYSSRIADWANV